MTSKPSSVHALYLALNIFIGPVLNLNEVSVSACSVGCWLLFLKAMIEEEGVARPPPAAVRRGAKGRERRVGGHSGLYLEPLALNEAAVPAISSWLP
jgi:hypothetical protein